MCLYASVPVKIPLHCLGFSVLIRKADKPWVALHLTFRLLLSPEKEKKHKRPCQFDNFKSDVHIFNWNNLWDVSHLCGLSFLEHPLGITVWPIGMHYSLSLALHFKMWTLSEAFTFVKYIHSEFLSEVKYENVRVVFRVNGIFRLC